MRSDVRIRAEYYRYGGGGLRSGEHHNHPECHYCRRSTSALEALEEQNNTIWIPADAVDISGEKSDYEEKINISDYLPED